MTARSFYAYPPGNFDAARPGLVRAATAPAQPSGVVESCYRIAAVAGRRGRRSHPLPRPHRVDTCLPGPVGPHPNIVGKATKRGAEEFLCGKDWIRERITS